ncbi:hypothetical protein [Georgenia sp. SUBG003]|uniref:hypothetical protein n=1 Tax=Georgenia sp. SUBG003 TaxID=1497974 RepID=UPI0004D733CE|nr:hypothetical protein DA06_16015 [Georgenia sp. SUBG003]
MPTGWIPVALLAVPVAGPGGELVTLADFAGFALGGTTAVVGGILAVAPVLPRLLRRRPSAVAAA